jgi:hypothetical protein
MTPSPLAGEGRQLDRLAEPAVPSMDRRSVDARLDRSCVGNDIT